LPQGFDIGIHRASSPEPEAMTSAGQPTGPRRADCPGTCPAETKPRRREQPVGRPWVRSYT
jgi:hypothetical protein